jgi:hypothetical protein
MCTNKAGEGDLADAAQKDEGVCECRFLQQVCEVKGI